MKLTVATFFSGYDSQCLALDRVKQDIAGFDYELIAWCEIEPNAITAHNLLYPQWKDRNLGDIAKCNWGGTMSYAISTSPFTHSHAKTSAMPDYKKVSAKGVEREVVYCGSARKRLKSSDLKC